MVRDPVESVADSRRLWSPALHRAFDQHCYFFLLSADDSRGVRLRSSLSQIHELLDIHGVTTHVILGPNDLLMRVWMTEAKRAAYLSELLARRTELSLQSLHEFETTHVKYTWLSAEESDLQRSLWREHYSSSTKSKVCDAIQSATNSFGDLATIHSTLPSGWQVRVPTVTGQKFYMFISHQDGTSPGMRPHDVIAAAATRLGVENISVYRGSGFCDYILKGVATGTVIQPDPQHRLMDVISTIQEDLSAEGMSGWSLAPPISRSEEVSETLDAIAGGEVEALVHTLLRPRLDEIKADELRQSLQNPSVAAAVASYLDTSGESAAQLLSLRDPVTRVRRRMTQTLSGVLANSRRRVNRELSFLVTMTSDANFAIALIEQEFGVKASPIFKSDTLTERSAYLLSLTENPRVSDFVSGFINLDDLAQVAHAVDVERDLFLQGKLLNARPGFRNIDKAFFDTLEQVEQAALLQIGLEGIIEQLE